MWHFSTITDYKPHSLNVFFLLLMINPSGDNLGFSIFPRVKPPTFLDTWMTHSDKKTCGLGYRECVAKKEKGFEKWTEMANLFKKAASNDEEAKMS